MKRGLRNLYFLIFVSSGITVIMEPKEGTPKIEEPSAFDEALGVCLSKKEHSTLECVNRGALSALQSLNERDNLGSGEIRLERAEGYGRDLLSLDYDPKDFGNVVKAAARMMERRNLKWNLDSFYPGLQMRVGPMLNGNGLLEFVVNERVGFDRNAGTGRQLARHLLLPFLLGFKFNLASLIPLLFGAVVLITKKALLLTKIAVLLSGLLGWNSLFSNSAQRPTTLTGFGHGYGYGYDAPAQGPYYSHNYRRPYRGSHGEYSPYGQHVVREVVDVYDADDLGRKGKNFAWSKAS